MVRGVNKVILIGNVGIEPETRHMPSGNAVTTLSLATSETWKDKQTGEKQERTEWHRVVCFNRLAEIVGEYVHKGSKLYIEGSIRTRKWQDQQGQERYMTEIVANDLQFLDSKGSNVSYEQENAQRINQNNNKQSIISTPQPDNRETLEELHDDIPF